MSERAGRKHKRGEASSIVFNQLKREILSGEIQSGALLSEAEIAKRFDVSRTPVRDALARLASERVLVALPQRGHLVRTVSFTEVAEAFRIREILEIEAVGEAALRITETELEELREILQSDQEDDVIWKNYNFHTKIARISGNRLLFDFIEEILILMQRLLMDHPDMNSDAIEPEKKILQALENHDPHAAKEEMRIHLRDVVERMFEIRGTRYRSE